MIPLCVVYSLQGIGLSQEKHLNCTFHAKTFWKSAVFITYTTVIFFRSNCHTYGTRFYRKLFLRPDFVAKESEIHFEKTVYMLQRNANRTLVSLCVIGYFY